MKFYYETMPRYSDFDKMGILHNSKYAILYEEGRLAMAISTGYSFEEITKNNITIVISEAKYCYKKPIFDIDKIIVELWIVYIKTYSIKIAFKITTDNGKTLNAIGYSIQAAINSQTKKLCKIPINAATMWSKYIDAEKISFR